MGKIHGSLTRKVAKQDKKKKPRGSADNRLQDLDGLKMIQQSETSLIPMEVVIEDILTRLPVKSLMRFKCVSKLWSSVISSRYFRNRFVKESRRLRFYLSLQDLKKQRHSVTLSMEADTSSSCFVVDHDLTIPMMGDSDLEYLAPGFICFTFLNHPRIFNPATRQLVTLPHPNIILPPRRRHNRVFVHYYYGYDPLMDKYTVLCSKGEDSESLISIRSEHHVLTIKAAAAAAAAGGGCCGGLWTMAAPTQPDFRPHVPIEGGVCIDGVLYYIGWTGGPAALVSYNTRSLDFEMLQLPRDEVPTWYLSLVVYSGKPTIIDYTRLRKKGMLDLWHLGKHDKSSCWFKETLVLQPCQLHLVKTNVLYDIKGTTQNGLLFLVPDDWFCPFHILCYDLQNNHLSKIEIKGVPDRWSKKLKHNVGVGYAFLCDDFSNVMFTDRSDDNHMYLY